MADKIYLGEEADGLIDSVLERVVQAVVSTMGPDGKVALIGSGDSSWTTKDGVTVAKSIKFGTVEEEIVNRIISEPAIKTDDECGDGTTTTVLLTSVIHAILRRDSSFKNRRLVERVVNKLIAALKQTAKFVALNDKELYKVALTTSNQDESLAQQVMDIYRSCEKGYPDVDIKPGRGSVDETERLEGRAINMYLADPWFAGTNNASKVTLKEYVPVVVDDRILRANPQDFFDGITNIRKQMDDGKSLATIVLVVRSIEKDPINTLSHILLQQDSLKKYNVNGLPGVVVAQTNLGGGLGAAEMVDIGSMLGAPYANGIEALRNVTNVEIRRSPLVLGFTRSSVHELDEEGVARIERRIGEIEAEIATYSYSDKFTPRARINERRIRKLRGEVVTILVGGETNQEIKERVDRYQDVVKAVRSALENGVLPGCGLGLINAARAVNKELENPAEREVLLELGTSIWKTLMWGHVSATFNIKDIDQEFPIINIATGEKMTSEDLEALAVWDTAYATITALKGGFQTAQYLATASSVFNTSKLHGRSVLTGH